MENVREIYLLGPSLSEISPEKIRTKYTLNYSGNLEWFNKNGVVPTYWMIGDPYLVDSILNNFKSQNYNPEWIDAMKLNCTLVYFSFLGKSAQYDIFKFTTPRGRDWSINILGNQILPELSKQFLKTKLIDCFLANDFDSLREIDNCKVPIVKPKNNINSEKLSYLVLPLVLSQFKNIETINCVGWGDFSVPREYNNNSTGYPHYTASYNQIYLHLKEILDYRNITVTFNNYEKCYMRNLGISRKI